MPRNNKLRKNTVIYLKGERPEFIYLIKDGRVMTTTTGEKSKDNPESAATVKKVLDKGDFLGLYSTIGNFPRQEDAVALTDVEVLLFTEAEFGDLVGKNPKFSLQLMRMLSKELRSIHRRGKETLGSHDSAFSSDAGLYNYIKLYASTGDSKKVVYVAKKFLDMFPQHSHFKEVQTILDEHSKLDSD